MDNKDLKEIEENIKVNIYTEISKLQIEAWVTKEPVKYFGFIKGKATKRYSVNAEGKIQEKALWYRFMYAEEKAESEE